MARPKSTYRDLTGHVVGSSRVIGRAARASSTHTFWRVLCDPGLGGCGRVRSVDGQVIREGRCERCRGCRGREHAARQAEAGHIGRLHDRIWPRTCGTCGAGFRGTARQKYCRPECRPSHAKE